MQVITSILKKKYTYQAAAFSCSKYCSDQLPSKLDNLRMGI